MKYFCNTFYTDFYFLRVIYYIDFYKNRASTFKTHPALTNLLTRKRLQTENIYLTLIHLKTLLKNQKYFYI